jgi:hypothetical protein
MNWLFSDFSNKFSYAIRNPRYALRSLFREMNLADEKFLSRITGCSVSEIRAFLDEPLKSPEFAATLKRAAGTMNSLRMHSADLYAKKILAQYAAIRALKPKTVIETGVANGVSSSYLLLALWKNAFGTLYSIEIGDTHYLPPDRQNGWIVPDYLRTRWQMRIGDSKSILPALLGELESCDVFVHDSLHTYDHMKWEFGQAYPFLRPGGLLFADDALWNEAFRDFAQEVGASEAEIIRGVGYLKKPSDSLM